MSIDQTQHTGGSHPAIRFKKLKMIEGPLTDFDAKRPRLLNDVVSKTLQDFSKSNADVLLAEALYSERARLRRDRGNLFTRSRLNRDRKIWSGIQGGLLKSVAEVDRRALLQQSVSHYAEEIGGHFDPKIYKISTDMVPWMLSWLLNAASVKRFLPWGMTESLESRMSILGEVSHVQKLAKKGTLLLVPTHQSNLDSVLIGYIIALMELPPFAYGAGLNLFSNPILSFFMSRLGSYTVDRKKTDSIYKATLKNYSTRILKEGVHSIFFPGGGRSRTGALESRLKLGLLGTALEAQIESMIAGSPKPNIYVVPMVVSYHYVLEASSLIEEFLMDAGKHRFILEDDESWQVLKIINFFWKFMSSQTGVTCRIGRPLDVFGNFVDDEGRSIGPNGTMIDPAKWCTTRGALRHEPQRDAEYTKLLGSRIASRYFRENTVLTSHLVAFSFFETLRKKYPDSDLYRFMRLSTAQRSMPLEEFLAEAEQFHKRVRELADQGQLFICEELKTTDTRAWVADGVRHLGLLHDAAVVKVEEGAIWTQDMTLLYYYRNRLSGYGLSLLAKAGAASVQPGQYDAKGFLA
ncbi:MAG: 1-acyl-sn-glycerol-3-phosphate acyltransferase [Bdellovibrionota bacterium]